MADRFDTVEGAREAQVIQAIRLVVCRGNGKDTVFREVIQYWSLDGEFLAEHDPTKEEADGKE